ncbi:MAG: T9SS type A sorting domain-containing protein [Bacteroidetes bacterium]|nr:T9SS type A sorting domain-containing protein [Bacteroidota bacterium]
MIIPALSQEIKPPSYGENLFPLSDRPVAHAPGLSSVKSSHRYYFLLDTISLPLTDDFSADFFKSHNPDDYPSASAFDSAAYGFLVNSQYFSAIIYSIDTTYQYFFDAGGILVDSITLLPTPVVFYSDSLNPFTPIDTGYYWPPFNIFDTAGFIPDTVFIVSPETLFNSTDTIRVIPDYGFSIWSDNYAYRNNTIADNPPTIGVATLDGLDEYGHAYDYDNPGAWGPADYLTSKPIDLEYIPGDSLYFSFYYQPQGIGNDPQPEDSLRLEFYSPVNKLWYRIWEVPGSEKMVFKRLMIPVTDTKYLATGFRFRFINNATLSGDFDHWHIDYIRLAANRFLGDTLPHDVAITIAYPSLIKDYSSMPWSHFIADSSNMMIDSINFFVRNLDTIPRNLDDFTILIKNQSDSIYSFISGNYNIDPLSDIIDTFPISYTCYYNDDDSAVFYVTKLVNTSLFADENRWNDTVRFVQKFLNYYSYDDGTAEAAYGLFNYYGAELALRFTSPVADTLRGISFSFVQALKDVSNLKFQLSVWTGTTMPESLIFRNTSYDKPSFPDGVNAFYTYLIDSPVTVSGTFFIGFEQLTDQVITLGYDLNLNSNDKSFYNLGTGWNNSQLNGTLLMRPVFGRTVTEGPATVGDLTTGFGISVYPNPNSGRFTVSILRKVSGGDSSCDPADLFDVRITNLPGQVVYDGRVPCGVTEINTGGLQPGFYIVHICTGGKRIKSSSMILQ